MFWKCGRQLANRLSSTLAKTLSPPPPPRQVNKKRHIGNDMVCVVFLDEPGAVFNPTWVRSNFIHCYIVVQHIPGARGQPLYKVCYQT